MLRRAFPLLALLAAPAAGQHDHHAGHATPVPARAVAGVPASARAQLDELARAVARYRDVELAKRDGWEPSPLGREDSPLMGEHWIRKGAREYGPGEPLDFSEPSNLQYALVDGRRELVGVSYVVRIAPGDPLPQGFAGGADHWHVHDVLKGVQAATEGRPLLRWLANAWIDREYRSKGDDRSRLATVHAWVTTPSPDGVFSMHNRAIPYLRVGLPLAYAERASDEAALGVNLASAEGCANSLNGMLWIAGASPKQKRAIGDACARASADVRASLRGGAGAVNAAGERAWAAVVASERATLSPDQLRRMDAITEHDPMNEHAHH